MATIDDEIVQFTFSRVRAGDPSAVTWKDDIDIANDLQPYCFKLKQNHEEGALAAIATYRPWWQDLKSPWEPAINDVRVKFKKWTKDKFTNKDKEATHVAMNSGSLAVPLGPEEDAFIEAYAKCLLAGHRMYFVEQLRYAWQPPCFRLFMDLDFKQLAPITERGIEAASCVCSTTVARFFPERPSHTIVSSTTYKNCSATDASGNKIQLVKTGVHLYWPLHFVTPLQCLHIRESILADLTEIFGLRTEPEMNVWEDVVDLSVYGNEKKSGSGLRMIGSCKTDVCADCKGRSHADNPCDACGGQRRVNDMDNAGRIGRPYMMLCVLKAPENAIVNRRDYALEKYYQNSMLDLIKDTKLRTALTEDRLEGFVLPPGAPIYVTKAAAKAGNRVGQYERLVEPTDPVHIELQKVIRLAFGDLYSQIVVKRVTKAKGAKAAHFTVSITGRNCRYCHNIGREHSSNNIYFIVSREGVVQRCHDTGPKTAEMRHGTCKDYASGLMALTVDSLAILWPEATENFKVYNQLEENMDSFLLKSLINCIDFHCRAVWPKAPSWPSVARMRRIGRGPAREFQAQDDRDLGSRGAKAYEDIGMLWSKSLLDVIGTPMIDDRPKSFKSIQHYERQVKEAFHTLIMLAASAAEPRIFAECQVLDDIMNVKWVPEEAAEVPQNDDMYV